MTKDQARQAVDSIIDDLKARAGIGDEFEGIHSSIQQEIRDEWTQRILLVANGD